MIEIIIADALMPIIMVQKKVLETTMDHPFQKSYITNPESDSGIHSSKLKSDSKEYGCGCEVLDVP